MMGMWDPRPLARDLPRLAVPLVLYAGTRDGMIPPAEAGKVAALVPQADVQLLAGLGHLAHEEAPDDIAARILSRAGATKQPVPS